MDPPSLPPDNRNPECLGGQAYSSLCRRRERRFPVSYSSDVIASAAEVHWATNELEQALLSKGVKMLRGERMSQANSSDLCIIAAGSTTPGSVAMLKNAGVQVASVPEVIRAVTH
jgi:hypothetical protein